MTLNFNKKLSSSMDIGGQGVFQFTELLLADPNRSLSLPKLGLAPPAPTTYQSMIASRKQSIMLRPKHHIVNEFINRNYRKSTPEVSEQVSSKLNLIQAKVDRNWSQTKTSMQGYVELSNVKTEEMDSMMISRKSQYNQIHYALGMRKRQLKELRAKYKVLRQQYQAQFCQYKEHAVQLGRVPNALQNLNNEGRLDIPALNVLERQLGVLKQAQALEEYQQGTLTHMLHTRQRQKSYFRVPMESFRKTISKVENKKQRMTNKFNKIQTNIQQIGSESSKILEESQNLQLRHEQLTSILYRSYEEQYIIKKYIQTEQEKSVILQQYASNNKELLNLDQRLKDLQSLEKQKQHLFDVKLVVHDKQNKLEYIRRQANVSTLDEAFNYIKQLEATKQQLQYIMNGQMAHIQQLQQEKTYLTQEFHNIQDESKSRQVHVQQTKALKQHLRNRMRKLDENENLLSTAQAILAALTNTITRIAYQMSIGTPVKVNYNKIHETLSLCEQRLVTMLNFIAAKNPGVVNQRKDAMLNLSRPPSYMNLNTEWIFARPPEEEKPKEANWIIKAVKKNKKRHRKQFQLCLQQIAWNLKDI